MDTAVEKQSRAIVVSSLFILVNIFFRQHYFRFRRCWQCSNKHRYIPTKKQKYSKRNLPKKSEISLTIQVAMMKAKMIEKAVVAIQLNTLTEVALQARGQL
jgi:hypothetical protein